MTFSMKNKLYILLTMLVFAACKPISSEYTYVVDNLCSDTIHVSITYWEDTTLQHIHVIPKNTVIFKHLKSSDYFHETFFYPNYLIKKFVVTKNGITSNINYLLENEHEPMYWECKVKWLRLLSTHGVEYRVQILDEHFER